MTNKIEIFDSRDIPYPPDRVVAQALASRSLKPFREHLDEINSDKTSSFYEKNVIGFGHDNINATGDGIIVSLPGISILAAKYIEDSPLFNGQESSTRYIDFRNQPCIGLTQETRNIVEHSVIEFQRIYKNEIEYNRAKFNPQTDIEDKAVKAYTLDVCRCLLPAGLTTNVNWVTNLRHLQDHCHYLISSVYPEIQYIGTEVLTQAIRKYPGIISPTKVDNIRHMAKYNEEYSRFQEDPVYTNAVAFEGSDPLNQQLDITYIPEDLDNIRKYESLKTRPRGCPPPRIYSSQFQVAGLMDFGSFRDLQRHRNGLCKIAPLNTYNGFENWYLDKMSENSAEIAGTHLEFVEEQFNKYQDSYIVPLGYRIPFIYQCSFEQLIYIAEIRSSKYVHPTCRTLAMCIFEFINAKLPEVALYIDRTPLDHFASKRGSHDIVTR
jgi:thymidylate synthase ThyX